MKGRQIAGWALAASVLVGVSGRMLALPRPPVLEQSLEQSEAEQLLEQVRKLQAQGRYTEAITLVKKNLSLQEKTFGSYQKIWV